MQIKNRVKELRMVKAGSIKPNPSNWRTHPKQQEEVLKGVIQEIGFSSALLARETEDGLVLIDGHLRRDLSKDDIVPVLVVDLSEEESNKLLAVYDPISAMASMDGKILKDLLEDVSFENEHVNKLVKQLLKEALQRCPNEGNTDPDSLAAEVIDPESKIGDLWLLGEHRILCGDATNSDHIEKLLEGFRPLLCVTDPPYGVEYNPEWRNKAAEKGQISYAMRRIGIVENDKTIDWSDAFSLFHGDVLYCWHSGRYSSITQQSLEKCGFEIRNQIIWSKPHSPITRGHYRWRHEPCWYGVKKGAKSLWIGDHSQTTIWDAALDSNVDGGHSTQKPVELIAKAIRNHNCPEVYEPFCGSGTTIIACEMLRRKCFAMEINPGYVDAAVLRWKRFTGSNAIKL